MYQTSPTPRYRFGFLARYLRPLVFEARVSRSCRQFEVAEWLEMPGHALSEYLTCRSHPSEEREQKLLRLGCDVRRLRRAILADKLLSRLRIPYAAANLGVSVAAHRMAVEYSKTRETFGAPLASRQAIQWMLVDSEVEIRACRWLIWEAAWKFDAGEDYRQEASIAKLYSAEALGRVVDRSIQIHGGYGVSRWLPLERWYREARIRRLGEGPSEIQRIVIAREMLNPGGRRE